MGMPKQRPFLTEDEYLAFERASFERHVYLDGEVFAMAGESDEHGIITVNLVITLGSQLKGKRCQVRTKDTKVRSGPLGSKRRHAASMFSYPDIIVVCGTPEYHDAFTDVLLNPTALIEVLSKHPEAFDRGEKFTRYQAWNPTLKDYLLISQDRPQIEHYSRQKDGAWSYRRVTGLEPSIKIASIKCKLDLADVYDRMVFLDGRLRSRLAKTRPAHHGVGRPARR